MLDRYRPGVLTAPDGQEIGFNAEGCLYPGAPCDLAGISDEQIESAREWLRTCAHATRLCRKPVYGGLKLDYERWRIAFGRPYVPQGGIIAALLLEGYMVTQQRWGSPNVYTNASVRRPGRPPK